MAAQEEPDEYIITVDTLINNSISRSAVADEVIEQIRAINERIVETNDKGWGDENVLLYPLPTVFNVQGTSPSLCRLVMYSSIITDLRKRKFTVQISISKDKAILVITWPAVFPSSDVIEMQNIINSAKITIDDFKRVHKKFSDRLNT